MLIRVATVQYAVSIQTDWQRYAQKIAALAIAAKQQRAHLLALPEYAGIEIGDPTSLNDASLFASIQPYLTQYITLFQQLAQQYQLYILAGTVPVQCQPKHYANRAYFFSPSGQYGYQDKLQFTEYEKQSQLLLPGTTQTLFTTQYGNIGIAICYDSEFPLLVQNLVAGGAWLILVPSYTTSVAGHHRINVSVRARAIENQCYIVNACMVGPVPFGTQTPEHTFGNAGIYAPADRGFPDNGIIAQGHFNQPNMLVAELSYDKINAVRHTGDVHNYEDAKALTSNYTNILLPLIRKDFS